MKDNLDTFNPPLLKTLSTLSSAESVDITSLTCYGCFNKETHCKRLPFNTNIVLTDISVDWIMHFDQAHLSEKNNTVATAALGHTDRRKHIIP